MVTIRIILSLPGEEEKSENPVHMKTKQLSLVLIPLLTCFSALPSSQAVSPPPDGGYPGFNTAEGQNALFSLTTGSANTAVGWFSLQSNLIGNFNTAVGAGTLLVNTADNNTATGAGALLNNTSGANNTASGVFALFDNTTGGSNTATGFGALGNNTTGSSNTANGANALLNNTTGANNTAIGNGTLFNNTIAFGNTAIGFQVLLNNTTGGANTAIGSNALVGNSTGGGNTAIGSGTLSNNTTGDSNTAIGNGALNFNTTGSENVALGEGAGTNVTTATNVICIGNDGANVNNSCFIGNIHGVTTATNDAIPVLIDSAGQLGTMSSSYRFKKDISTMEKSSEAILSLRPVTFHYKTDTKDTPQFGLIAEEVAKANPDLVVRDKKDEIYTVRYDAVNAMLLNEFLKEHRKIQELEATVAKQQKDFQATATHQQKQIEALTEGFRKVSAQLEASKPAPQTVAHK